MNNGDIVEDLSLVDLIKENYALLVGEIACDSAIDFFNEALASDDLTVKREKMLYGAFLATIGCEMSIEDTDAIVKNEGKSTDDILNDIKKWETEKLYN